MKKRRWQLLQVESAIACNLRCVMCPWPEYAKRAKNRGIMTPDIWNAIRSHLPQVRSVDFTGGGEPLLQPNLLDWIREAHAAGCETGILTNGLLLTESKAAKLIEADVDWICVSMDGATRELYEQIRIGSNFDRVAENVGNLSRLRVGKIPKLMINFVLMTINVHQVEEIVRLASRLGVDQVNYKQCEVIRGERGKGYGLFGDQETREIRKLKKSLAKARRLAKKMGIHTTAFSFTPEEQPVCDQNPRSSLFIGYDGVVAPCINLALGGPTTFLGQEVNLPTVHYGRLPADDLLELWDTETCRLYRERFQDRIQTHDAKIIAGLISTSASDRLKALKQAKEAMPAAPRGCDVCHYLYDI
ncbi:MAG: radical SAM protein [Planctomycetota bacterium]|jgi:MoaA/NifB/PqqE/SkfB family radical SAM enzyme